MSINVFLYVLAFVLLLLAAVGVPAGRVSLGWLGLAFYVLTYLTPLMVR